MFQSAFATFTNQHVGQTCSWCHTNALIKLGLISQFSSASASSSLPPPLPNFPACPLHYSHLQSSSWSQLCGTWANCSKAPKIQISSLQSHTFQDSPVDICYFYHTICLWKSKEAVHFPSLWGGLETERRRFSRSVNPLDTLRHNGSIKCKHTPMCTDTKSVFSFLRDRALAQGWPLYHNNLIHFASLCLSLYFRVGSLVHCPFVAPLNSRSQTFVSSPPPQFLRFFFASSAFLCVGHASFTAALMWLNVTPASSFDSIYFILSMRTTDPSIFHSCPTEKSPSCDSGPHAAPLLPPPFSFFVISPRFLVLHVLLFIFDLHHCPSIGSVSCPIYLSYSRSRDCSDLFIGCWV